MLNFNAEIEKHSGIPPEHLKTIFQNSPIENKAVKDVELRRWNKTIELLESFALQIKVKVEEEHSAVCVTKEIQQQHKENSAGIITKLCTKVNELQIEKQTLEERLQRLEAAIKGLKQNESESKERCRVAEAAKEIAAKENEIKVIHVTAAAQLVKQAGEALQLFRFWHARLQAARQAMELERRLAFNRLQELKGNLRVFCRIRPLLPSEREMPEVRLAYNDEQTSVTLEGNARKNAMGQLTSRETDSVTFNFDRVFPTSEGQQQIFEEVSHFVQSALDGFNVCLFAYGQTGSGKTHTMMGGSLEVSDSSAGVIPRALQLIFASMRKLSETGMAFKAWLSVLEIHNETVRDLLVDKVCDVRLDGKGNATVVNKTKREVASTADVLASLGAAEKHRSVAATAANSKSSRSHCIVQLRIDARSAKANFESTLSLVDLAGSERLERSQATGDRLREAQAINRSLSCLGDVIAALAARRSHIPYRNSKLTQLLRSSLGGHAKTLMFVNCSPLRDHLGETLCSLRFAARATGCPGG